MSQYVQCLPCREKNRIASREWKERQQHRMRESLNQCHSPVSVLLVSSTSRLSGIAIIYRGVRRKTGDDPVKMEPETPSSEYPSTSRSSVSPSFLPFSMHEFHNLLYSSTSLTSDFTPFSTDPHFVIKTNSSHIPRPTISSQRPQNVSKPEISFP